MPDGFLPVVQKAYDLTRWLLPVVEDFPRKFKFTLGDRLQAAALDLSLALVEASHARARERPLHRADRLLDQLRLLGRLAHDLRLLPLRRYERLSEAVEEIGRMIGGWLRHARQQAHPRPGAAGE
jgi:hypothetical protein